MTLGIKEEEGIPAHLPQGTAKKKKTVGKRGRKQLVCWCGYGFTQYLQSSEAHAIPAVKDKLRNG